MQSPSRAPQNQECNFDQTTDWSGYSSGPKGRKQFLKPLAMCDQLAAATGGGEYFGPCSDAVTNEWKHSGRKNAAFCKDAVGMETSAATVRRWETEAQAAMNKHHTVLDQLTDFGRAIHVRGRKAVTPSFETKQTYDPQLAKQRRDENPYNLNSSNCRIPTTAISNLIADSCSENNCNKDNLDQQQQLFYDLVGFRAHLEAGGAEGGINSLGAQLLEQFNNGSLFLPVLEQVDPYKVANGQRRKDLLLENYSNTTPGYTGKKKPNLYI